MTRLAFSLAAAAALITTGFAAPSLAGGASVTGISSTTTSQDTGKNAGQIQLAQAGPYYRRRYGYYGPRRPYRPYYGPPPRRPYYGPGPAYGYRPYGVVSPGVVRLRLLARGYYAIRAIRYVPRGPRPYARGPGARFPGYYVAVARRIGVTYRFRLNPFTGRPYARVRIY